MAAKKKASPVKKILIVVGALFTSLILAAVCIPFFVNVDKYRPEILAKVNENINGKLELGKLDLSLWGRVHVRIDGLKLVDANAKPSVSVKDAELNLPFLSILSGRPELRLVLKEPNLELIKLKNGKYNAMALVKESAASAPTTQATPTQGSRAQAAPAPSAGLPKMLLAARFTFLIKQANLLYFDQASGDKHKIQNLNLTLEDVSPSGSIPFELTADLDMVSQGIIKIQGPLSF